jgi:hypothetical protein
VALTLWTDCDIPIPAGSATLPIPNDPAVHPDHAAETGAHQDAFSAAPTLVLGTGRRTGFELAVNAGGYCCRVSDGDPGGLQ